MTDPLIRGVHAGEWYPVYSLDKDGARRIEISAADAADYERVMSEFAAWQERLSRWPTAPDRDDD